MRKLRRAWAFVLVLLLLSAASLIAARVPWFKLNQDTPAGGGLGRMSNSQYILDSTLGQVAPGHSENSQYRLDAGFWVPTPGASITTPAPWRPGAVYLPAIARNHPPAPPTPTPTVTPTLTPTATATPTPLAIEDAPQNCPGYPVELGARYRENFDELGYDPIDRDWYQFDAQANLTLTIRTFDLGAKADTLVWLVAPDCATELAYSDDWIEGQPSSGSLIVWNAAAAGTYHVRVENFDWTVYGEGTEYTLAVSVGQPPAAMHLLPARASKPARQPTPAPGGR